MNDLEIKLLGRLYKHHFEGDGEWLVAEEVAVEFGESRERGQRAAQELMSRGYISAPFLLPDQVHRYSSC
jgi:hypothetical protein